MQKQKPFFSLGWGLAGLLVLTFLGTIWLNSTPVNASNDGIWTELPAQTQLSGVRRIVPDRYRVLQANPERLKEQLAKAPLESPTAWENAPKLELPLPDGRWWSFTVVSAPIMESELAAKYPDITTYLARATHDSSITARLDFTPQGFHGLIFDHSDSYFIDPYRDDDIEHYISYSRREYMTIERRKTKGLNETPPQAKYDSPPSHTPGIYRSGETLRTYRLAVAATYEYTSHFGSKANAMAALTTTVNRVVGVYEKEVAVRMVLIANNDLIVYDTVNDPYGSDLLGDNQDNLDATIGSANYDIGHVFDLGDGGVAYLGVVCNNNFKAMGMTGRNDPTGDPFDIDYVAHEMGHQFGANHTFNGTTGACGGGNRETAAAYEPGSGSTIMAYAGICGSEDLQPNSDPYFHYKSLQEIATYVSTDGNSCAFTEVLGNQPPVVNAGADYTIPARTPFELTGSATDPNSGDTLTYAWEEYDLGPASPPNNDSQNKARPIFRSFNPTTSPTRIFPRLQDILNNTTTFGEALSVMDRTMTFRLTVRDNNASSGGFGTDTMALTVKDTTVPFQITAPNTAVSWEGNSQQTVTWDVAGTTAAPISCASVNILLSTDGGQTFPINVATTTANDGSETITVPNVTATGTARIKVRCSTSVFFDITNANFTITPSAVVMRYVYIPIVLK